MTQADYDKVIEIIESSYHRASGQYQLPHPESAAYNAAATDGMYWSCPMRPAEISARISNEFHDKILDNQQTQRDADDAQFYEAAGLI